MGTPHAPRRRQPGSRLQVRPGRPDGRRSSGPGGVEPLWRNVSGEVLRRRRRALRRTLQRVADTAGISPQYLSEVERGRKEPSSEMLSCICGALDWTLGELLAAGQRQLSVTAAGEFTLIRLGRTLPTRTGRPGDPVGRVRPAGAVEGARGITLLAA